MRILDVGCGAGLLCEPLARLGAEVIGLDAVEENIICAKEHAAKDPIGNRHQLLAYPKILEKLISIYSCI